MTYMIEIYYKAPPDEGREARVGAVLRPFGAVLDDRSAPTDGVVGPIVLTYEFASAELAVAGAKAARALGEHVEGPQRYGP